LSPMLKTVCWLTGILKLKTRTFGLASVKFIELCPVIQLGYTAYTPNVLFPTRI